MWRRDDLAKLNRTSSAERRLLVEAAFCLGVARSVVLLLPFRWTTKLLGLCPALAIAVEPVSDDVVAPIAWALRIASSRSPWRNTCLSQALAGVTMLRRRRIPAILTLGIAREAGGRSGLSAHAWLSCGSLILTGAGVHEDFKVVARYSAGF